MKCKAWTSHSSHKWGLRQHESITISPPSQRSVSRHVVHDSLRGNRFLGLAESEAVATLDQVFQPLDEPSGWCAVDNIMIEAQRHAAIFLDGYVSVHDAWFLTAATSTSSNKTRCLLPLRHACRDLFSSMACARQAVMNAVNDKDSPVFALWSLR